MRFKVFLTFLALFSTFEVHSQCLTEFTKLVPSPSVDYTLDFGRSISLFDDFLAVGIPNSDTLGRVSGLVQLFKKNENEWAHTAYVVPPEPLDGLQFGVSAKLSKDYLLIGAAGYGGKVYVFKKTDENWSGVTHLATLTYPGTQLFGVGYGSANPIEISSDQQTIIISDVFFLNLSEFPTRSGALFIYHKETSEEWNNGLDPVMLFSPEDETHDFGRAGISISGTRLITAAPIASTANGILYVFNDPSGTFQNLEIEAKLSSGTAAESFYLGTFSVVSTTDGIFTIATVDYPDDPKFGIIYFKRPDAGIWENATPTCFIDPKGDTQLANTFPLTLSTNGTEIFATSRDVNGKGYFIKLLGDPDEWCNPKREFIDIHPAPQQGLPNNYGIVHTVNPAANHAAIGFVSSDNENVTNALKVLSRNEDNLWEGSVLQSGRKSTAGHLYGRNIIGFNNYLFVSAPYDGTVKANAGIVYGYRKTGNTWQVNTTIKPPIGGLYDDVFGTSLATDGEELLAVGAYGHESHGKVFVYKKLDEHWSTFELMQEITLPEFLTVYQFGDNLAIHGEWLVIPYVQNSPARIMLAIFKYDGQQWQYHQVVEVGFTLFRSNTMAVAIRDNLMVIGGNILEINNEGFWEIRHILSPSDPEPMQISSDFTHWITNGSLFGHSVAIHDNTIFIGAPLRDYGSTWDVGAVYVYVKDPDESWSSRTETVKLVPRVKEERELFGASISAFYNTVIIGAVGSDYNKNDTPRNKPGRAYIFQSEDYYWENVIPLMDFTGDSFEKDYFGFSVYIDRSDFFVGAPIEDISTGKLSGSVYVIPPPPIVKLIPPVCVTEGTRTLFGYPFGGTWSGPGIVNPQTGQLDLNLAGVGNHEYEYTTPSCTYTGKLRLRILAAPVPLLEHGTEIFVCKDSPVNHTLRVTPHSNTFYLWFYRANTSQAFTSLEIRTPEMQATQRGEYQVMVSNSACSVLSPIIKIQDENIAITIDEPGQTCAASPTPITLSASPSGGVWSGMGVSGNIFSSLSLSAGSYVLTYRYTSPVGCVYQQLISIPVINSFVPVINRLSGHLCDDGTVTLGIAGTPPLNFEAEWELKRSQENYFTAYQSGGLTVNVTEHGSYRVKVKHATCESVSPPININDTFSAVVLPSGGPFEVCAHEEFYLHLQLPIGGTLTWFYYENDKALTEVLNQQSSVVQTIKTGYYYARVNNNACVFETEPRYVVIYPSDSVFVPNIFTPNGDIHNPVFQASGAVTEISLQIINRYGKTIFIGDGYKGWDGGDAASGIYFWTVQYPGCRNEPITKRGTVHLFR